MTTKKFLTVTELNPDIFKTFIDNLHGKSKNHKISYALGNLVIISRDLNLFYIFGYDADNDKYIASYCYGNNEYFFISDKFNEFMGNLSQTTLSEQPEPEA